MGRRAYPQSGIEYTFKFRNGDRTHYTTLIFEGVNSKGRLEFYNKQTGAYTSMPDKRFAYIHRFNLVSEKSIIENVALKVIKVPMSSVKVECELESELEGRKELKKMAENLRNLDANAKLNFAKSTGKNIEELALRVERAFDLDIKTMNCVMSEYFDALNTLGLKVFA